MLDIKTAEELVDPELEVRWALRRAARQGDVLHQVLRAFIRQAGPIPVETIMAALSARPPDAVRESLGKLDEDDLIQVAGGHVEIAYPFSGRPTAFIVRLAGGHERFACCAIDALGIAPMVGEEVHVRSRCHHCGHPLEFSVTPGGPGREAAAFMVWVGQRGQGQQRIAASL
jgi:Alkylmercury lyase